MATADLTDTTAEHCEINRLLLEAFRDAISELEHYNANSHQDSRRKKDNTQKTQPDTTISELTKTPAAQLKLAADKFAGDDQLNQTLNLNKELEMTTPARNRDIHPNVVDLVAKEDISGSEKIAMGHRPINYVNRLKTSRDR